METNKGEFEQKLCEFLGSTKGSRFDKSAIVYDWILETEEPEAAFRFFLENADYIDSSEEKDIDAYFTALQLKKYDTQYSDLIDALLNKLVLSNLNTEQFYSELWKNVNKSDMLFDERDAKIYALGRIWSDGRIPYFCLGDGMKMSNEEFATIIEQNKKLLQEVTFILNCKHEQRTETSSLLLSVIEKCSDRKERAVVMAKIIDQVEKRILYQFINN